MYEITLKQLKTFAENSREAIWRIACAHDIEPKIYLHWTAGTYDTTFPDYHICITGEGKIFLSTPDLWEVLSHTWCRNSGTVGIALCCAYGATTNYLGAYPPTAKQIEVMAQVITVIADALWLTIDKAHVLTHGEAANNEDGLYVHERYAVWSVPQPADGDTRWDLEYLGTDESPSYNPYSTYGTRGGDVLRGKANWYRAQGVLK